MKSTKFFLSSLILLMMLFVMSVSANAALVDNGDGTITDTDRGIMWLQDANYAMTSGYDADGRMTWDESMTWADTLIYAGFDDWRLPSALNSDGSGPCSVFETCTDSEMGHLYYIEEITLSSPGPFTNINQNYWANTRWDPNPAIAAWHFDFEWGEQDGLVDPAGVGGVGWAVRVVPEPVSSTLFLIGGATLGFRRFRKKFKK